jgi:hypothetical protein
MSTLADLLIQIGVDVDDVRKGAKAVGTDLTKAFNKLDDVAGKAIRGLAGLSAVVPAAAGAAAGAISLGAAVAGAGAALGVFGAVTKTAMSDVTEASTKVTDLSDKIALYKTEARLAAKAGQDNSKYLKKQAEATLELQARLKNLPPATREATMSFIQLKSDWQDFVEQNKPAVFGIMTRGYKLIGASVLKLQPLFDIGERAVSRLLGAMENAAAGGFIDRLVARAGPAMDSLTNIILNVSKALGNTFGRFGDQQGQSILKWLDDVTAKWLVWTNASGDNAPLTKIVNYMQSQGPQLVTTLGQIALAAVHIAQAVAPLAPVTTAVAAALARLVAAVPPSWITAIVAGFIAWSVAIKAYAAYTVAASVATKAAAVAQVAWKIALGASNFVLASAQIAAYLVKVVAVRTATGLAVAAQALWNAALVAGNFAAATAQLAAFLIKQGAIAVATKAWAAAQWLLNIAMDANPIGLIVLAVAALVGVIILLWNHSEAFRKFWIAAWNAIKIAAAAAWNWIKQAAVVVFNFLVAAVKKYISIYVGAWKLVANAAIAAWNWIKGKAVSFFNWILSMPSKVNARLSSMWNGLKSGFRAAINWVIGKWNSLHFTIPSFSVLGHKFGGGTIGVPNIPQLASGGIVKAAPGGTLVNVGEGGRDEAVVPLDRGAPALGGRDDPTVVVQIVPGGEQEFRRWIRKSFRVKNGRGGGQVVLA